MNLYEMFIENQNDDVADKAYQRVAGQAEFDAFWFAFFATFSA